MLGSSLLVLIASHRREQAAALAIADEFPMNHKLYRASHLHDSRSQFWLQVASWCWALQCWC